LVVIYADLGLVEHVMVVPSCGLHCSELRVIFYKMTSDHTTMLGFVNELDFSEVKLYA
jgi:hypothetical protein